MTMLYFPGDISDAMSICALRFDGYKYEEVSGLSEPDVTGAGLSRLIEPIERTLMLHVDDNMNFAAFFGLQRYLHKWGGEFCTKYDDSHIAYDFLFLHLYNRDVPDGFRHAESCARWQREFEERKEEIAGFVRNSFRRKGHGEKIVVYSRQARGSSPMTKYKTELINRYWAYQQRFFPQVEDYFDRPFAPDGRPPVFLEREAWRNVITNPDTNQQEIEKLLALVPDRHKWFRSMNSSQALAQSVLGNLAMHGLLSSLTDLPDDDGLALFGKAQPLADDFTMEFKVDYLREPRCTSLDGYIGGDYRVAIECKFTEAEVGTCSRPRLTPANSNYESDHCDGTYVRQRARKERCSLTEVGILYWRYIPQLFCWNSEQDLLPCPFAANYQLVRNVLAIGVSPNGEVSLTNGHVVLIYDDRNPAFQKGGAGFIAFMETQQALREPTMLRKCSWQRITQYMRNRGILSWLTEQLESKYGL